MKKWGALLVGLATTVATGGTFKSGSDLSGMAQAYQKVWIQKSKATSNEELESTIFMGYVIGVVDATEGVVVCPPTNVKAGQVAAMAAKYIDSHPEEWNLVGAELVVKSLRGTFPCPYKQ